MAVYGQARHQKNMAVYGPVRQQKNIIWTSEASVHILFFFGDGPVHIHVLPYDPQCHELFAMYIGSSA